MKLVLLWGPVLLVMALIFYLSSLPDPGGPPGGISDKTAHCLIYGALGATMMRALAGGRAAAMALPTILAAIVLTTLYGVSDEIHQYFVPPRTPDLLDVAADAAGACAGAIVVTVLARLRPGWFRPSGAARSRPPCAACENAILDVSPMTEGLSLQNLLLERDDAIAVVTVNRPKVLNALNLATLEELHRTMTALRGDAAIRCVILTGSGEKSFAAGADINELGGQSPTAGREHARLGQAVFDTIETLGKPVIAAINGYALGGGCELAMACTIRLAADTARLGQPEINLGMIPGYGGTQRLARIVGSGRALELLLTGDQLSAAEAHRLGLVNHVVPASDLMVEARKLAATIAGKAPLAVRYVLEAVHRGVNLPLAEALTLEAALFGLVVSTDDMREGTRAFLEKRKPVFKGL